MTQNIQSISLRYNRIWLYIELVSDICCFFILVAILTGYGPVPVAARSKA